MSNHETTAPATTHAATVSRTLRAGGVTPSHADRKSRHEGVYVSGSGASTLVTVAIDTGSHRRALVAEVVTILTAAGYACEVFGEDADLVRVTRPVAEVAQAEVPTHCAECGHDAHGDAECGRMVGIGACHCDLVRREAERAARVAAALDADGQVVDCGATSPQGGVCERPRAHGGKHRGWGIDGGTPAVHRWSDAEYADRPRPDLPAGTFLGSVLVPAEGHAARITLSASVVAATAEVLAGGDRSPAAVQALRERVADLQADLERVLADYAPTESLPRWTVHEIPTQDGEALLWRLAKDGEATSLTYGTRVAAVDAMVERNARQD